MDPVELRSQTAQPSQWLNATQLISRSHHWPIQAWQEGLAHQSLEMEDDRGATVTQAPPAAEQEKEGIATPTRVLPASAFKWSEQAI